MSNGGRFQQQLKHEKSSKTIIKSMKLLIPSKNSIGVSLLSITFSIILCYSVVVKHRYSGFFYFLELSSDVLLILFGITLTLYSFFTYTVSKNMIKIFIEYEKTNALDKTSNFKKAITEFESTVYLMFISFVTTLCITILVQEFKEELLVLYNITFAEIVLNVLLFIYIYAITRSILEIKSTINNTFLFYNAYFRLMATEVNADERIHQMSDVLKKKA